MFHDEGSPKLACWTSTRVRDILEGKAMRVAALMQRAATVAGLSRDTRNPVDMCTDYLLVQGADRLRSTQDMGWFVPSGAIPFDMGGQFAADLGYGMAGPGGRGTGTPYGQ